MTDYKQSIAGKNLKKFRNSLGLKQSELAKTLDLPQSQISNIENSSRNITEAITYKIANRYNDLNLNWLFKSKGEMMLSNADLVREGETPYNSNKNIFVPYHARAGYLNDGGQELKKQQKTVNIPTTIKGHARTFEIRGDSMYPYVLDRDLVVCSAIEKAYEIKSGKVYVIISNIEGVVIKFATFLGDKLLMKSSADTYQPIEIKLEDVKEIWEVKYKITSHLTPSGVIYEERMNSIENKLDQILNKK